MKKINGIIPLKKDYKKMFIINQYIFSDPAFKFTINIASNGGNFILPTRVGYTYNCVVYWGDGSSSEITAYNDADITHTYTLSGNYQITIIGTFEYMFVNNGTEKLKILSVDNWGENIFIGINFYGCSNLASLPFEPVIFNGSSLSTAFANCTGLTSIPERLFEKAINNLSFFQVFYGCTGITSISDNLFKYNVNATSFQSSFAFCSNISSVPSDLFKNNVNSVSFANTFDNCIGIRSLGENLFYYNNLVTSYFRCFQACRNIAMPTVLFNLANLSIVTTFQDFMNVTSTIYSPTGSVQDIWNYATGATPTNCYDQCTALTNYASIPAGWV